MEITPFLPNSPLDWNSHQNNSRVATYSELSCESHNSTWTTSERAIRLSDKLRSRLSSRMRKEKGVEKMEMGAGDGRLFTTEKAKGRRAYKLFFWSLMASTTLIWFYRGRQMLDNGEYIHGGEGRWWVLVGLFASETWFSFYWLINQTVRWNPIHRSPFKEKLSQRCESELPKIDMLVCTADPMAEPPPLVISTVLSLMAYNYPTEKLSLYLSDDAGSILTFYALWEASLFSKHWLPFCKKFDVEPRSPAAVFSKPLDHHNEWSRIKNMYEEMVGRINKAVECGEIPAELEEKNGFSKWHSGMTSKDHQQIVNILIDGREAASLDIDGDPLPTLVYVAREKRPGHHHNFKAGAMNALLRVSSVISNASIILNVDCDMYSNNSDSIRDALCFFLDEEEGQNIAFVQYPQYFDNITKNDLYAGSLNVINEIELPGLDGYGGPPYIGTGCFHRREALNGRIYTKEYKEDWKRGIENEEKSLTLLEERAMDLAACTYEDNTLWGKAMGLIYGCAVEDIITGLKIQCKGWRSISYNPQRRGFLGVSPTTLTQSLLQYQRWSEGNLQIVLSKNCSLVCGHGKIKFALRVAYLVYGLWALNSLPTLYYTLVPSICLLKGISLFPKISSPWFAPFAYVFFAKNAYSLFESLMCGNTLLCWWNLQRMWLLKCITSFLFATIDNLLKLIGFSRLSFMLTSKAADNQDLAKRYKEEVMEFGSSSPMLAIIGAVAMLNLVCLIYGVKRVLMDGEIESFMAQFFLCCLVVALNMPIYEGIFFRKDGGRIPPSTALTSIGITLVVCCFFII